MERSYYSNSIQNFLNEEPDTILGKLARNNSFSNTTSQQQYAWQEEIAILKRHLSDFKDGELLLEYSIPRMGKRVDAVVLCKGIVTLLEFKVGDDENRSSTYNQVLDYALDLKNFQLGCQDLIIVPIAVPTESPETEFELQKYSDNVVYPISANRNNLGKVMKRVFDEYERPAFDYSSWKNAVYMPTPTIIEAAQALYNNHKVEEISRSDAQSYNLSKTFEAIKLIIKNSKKNRRKSIIFITGVPGAGKTLVGLNLASEFHNKNEGEHAVFLSGNFPLVEVLQEALARDRVAREEEQGKKLSKKEALREVKSFIQIIHTYRDEYVGNNRKPTEHVAIFDESQRSWTKEKLKDFMKKKKGISDFDFSEPEFLISTIDRFDDWGVIVCLVGGGQEINKGEAGMPEWFVALQNRFNYWDVYTADTIKEEEYLRSETWESLTSGLNITINNELYLATSMRSFRSENVSFFIKSLLENNVSDSQKYLALLKEKYPIMITRNLEKAKEWVQEKARGSERYGILVSSNSKRIKPYGIEYNKSNISPKNWFLNQKEDIRSSCFLEEVASEFETQGLEIDYAIVAWDADLRIQNGKWVAYQMSFVKNPPDWSPITNSENKLYLKNAYRVLLTRARQGFIIFIPTGSDSDLTRKSSNYDETFDYLIRIGIPEL